MTFGFNQTIWKNPRYGALNFMGQYMYEVRDPWYWSLNEAGGKGSPRQHGLLQHSLQPSG